ncbi:hypothetical protein ABFV99_13315 [Cytobacillus horneckiae]|uniref:hypothetical protein n=1 Tax=Cytobacillus horneckiae TaxID=549687 RepID=UPI0034CDDDB0
MKGHYNRDKCPTCLGDKKIITEYKCEEMKVNCPKCNGYGYISAYTNSVEKGRIHEIKMHTWAEGRQFTVEMYVEPTSYRASDSVNVRNGEIFKTKEECETALKD